MRTANNAGRGGCVGQVRNGQGSASTIDISYVARQAQAAIDNCVDMVILQGTTGEVRRLQGKYAFWLGDDGSQ